MDYNKKLLKYTFKLNQFGGGLNTDKDGNPTNIFLPNQMKCGSCKSEEYLTNENAIELSCGHLYHKKCIQDYDYDDDEYGYKVRCMNCGLAIRKRMPHITRRDQTMLRIHDNKIQFLIKYIDTIEYNAHTIDAKLKDIYMRMKDDGIPREFNYEDEKDEKRKNKMMEYEKKINTLQTQRNNISSIYSKKQKEIDLLYKEKSKLLKEIKKGDEEETLFIQAKEQAEKQAEEERRQQEKMKPIKMKEQEIEDITKKANEVNLSPSMNNEERIKYKEIIRKPIKTEEEKDFLSRIDEISRKKDIELQTLIEELHKKEEELKDLQIKMKYPEMTDEELKKFKKREEQEKEKEKEEEEEERKLRYSTYNSYQQRPSFYNPYASTPGMRNPYSSTPGMHNPYSSTPGMRNPYASTPGMYTPYASTPGMRNPPPARPDMRNPPLARQPVMRNPPPAGPQKE